MGVSRSLGYWDSQWRLLPSLNRRAHVQRYIDVGDDGDEYVEPDYLQELKLRTDFANALDSAGLEVPDSELFRGARFDPDRHSPVDRRTHRLMALAPHQGVPTRLLDWTAHANYAAYFAAVGVVGARDHDGELEVWALRLRYDAQQGVILGCNGHDFVQLVTAPRVTSKNQHAQRGLFTITELPSIPVPLAGSNGRVGFVQPKRP